MVCYFIKMMKKGVCASCGKEFESIHYERDLKFCSKKCFGVSLRGVKKNEEFCKKISDSQKNRTTKYPKSFTCKTCCRSFYPKRRPSKGRDIAIYCSRACSHGEKTEAIVTRRYRQYIHGAAARNIHFKLSMLQFLSFWGEPCWYCGEQIKGIGLDRVDNEVGYEFENIVPCCGICNKMKRDLEMEYFIEKCKKICYNKTIWERPQEIKTQ